MKNNSQNSWDRRQVMPSVVCAPSSSQHGATLIVVLVFLMLIVSVGVIAVRQSGTSLKFATSEQVDLTLLNSSDSVHARLEQAINRDGSTEYVDIISAKGAFGYFMNALGNTNRGDQLIFCYGPREEKFFELERTSILTPDGGEKLYGGSGDGYCDVSKSSSYTSARNTSATQVTITRPDANNTPKPPFAGYSRKNGVNINDPTSEQPLFDVYSTATIPSMSSASDTDINDCFKKPDVQADRFKNTSGAAKFDETLSECLLREGVPSQVLVQQARLVDIQTSDLCIGFGKGSGSISNECQEKYQLKPNGDSKSSTSADD